MNATISSIISSFSMDNIVAERKQRLDLVVTSLKNKMAKREAIRLIFICTHNSRRSHLSQVWAQTMAAYFGVHNITCCSGGTEETSIYSSVLKALNSQGYESILLSSTINPIYAVKYDTVSEPIVCFSKKYTHSFNPSEKFIAIMTCIQAEEGCPVVFGAESRFSLPYHDPKEYDHTPLEMSKYQERSIEIGQEMWYIFSQL